jgi:hypothetical protein
MEVNGQLHDLAALPPGKERHWIGGWVGPRAGLDVVVKRKNPAHAETQTLDHPARNPALYH